MTGTYDGFYAKLLYLRLSELAKGQSGYFNVSYCDMATAVGMTWAKDDTVTRRKSVEMLNGLLYRLADATAGDQKLIYLRSSRAYGCVSVWMSTNPRKLAERHGSLYLDSLLDVGNHADPWRDVGRDGTHE